MGVVGLYVAGTAAYVLLGTGVILTNKAWREAHYKGAPDGDTDLYYVFAMIWPFFLMFHLARGIGLMIRALFRIPVMRRGKQGGVNMAKGSVALANRYVGFTTKLFRTWSK